jgi:hypothetical protein
MIRLSSRLALALGLLVATARPSVPAADIDTNKTGELIREGILHSLGEVRAKTGELSATEALVKPFLATDARMKDLKAAKIEREGSRYTLDIWVVDTRTGTFTITLTNPTRTDIIMFEGSATARDGAAYRVVMKRVLRGHGK